MRVLSCSCDHAWQRGQMLTRWKPQLAVSLPSHSCLECGMLSLQQETRAQVGSKEQAVGVTDLSGLFVGQLRKTLGFWTLEKQLNAVSHS